jgi:hypothetical protein
MLECGVFCNCLLTASELENHIQGILQRSFNGMKSRNGL